MRTLSFGMNASLDGYVAAPGDDLSWSTPSDELFQWWSDRLASAERQLYGRRIWEAMSAHWPTADTRPDATAATTAYAERWRAAQKDVFSSTLTQVEGNARLVSTDAVEEVARLKADGDGRMDVAGATLAAAVARSGLVDEWVVVTHPVLLGGGARLFTDLEQWVHLDLVESRAFDGGCVLSRYATRR